MLHPVMGLLPRRDTDRGRCLREPGAPTAGQSSLLPSAGWQLAPSSQGQGQTKERQAAHTGRWRASEAKEVAQEAWCGQPQTKGSRPATRIAEFIQAPVLPDQPLTSPGLILGTAPTGAGSRAHSPRPGGQGAPIAWVQLMGQPKVMSSPWPPPTPVRSGDVPPLNILSVKRLNQREPHSFQKTAVGCTLIDQ